MCFKYTIFFRQNSFISFRSRREARAHLTHSVNAYAIDMFAGVRALATIVNEPNRDTLIRTDSPSDPHEVEIGRQGKVKCHPLINSCSAYISGPYAQRTQTDDQRPRCIIIFTNAQTLEKLNEQFLIPKYTHTIVPFSRINITNYKILSRSILFRYASR